MQPSPIERQLTFVPRGAAPVAGRIVVEAPRTIDDEEARCLVIIEGPPRLAQRCDVAGADRLQALCLAVLLIGTTLRDFVARGGRILDEGEDFALDAYFGQLALGARAPQPSRLRRQRR